MSYFVKIISKGLFSKKGYLAIIILFLSMSFAISGLSDEGLNYLFKYDYISIFLSGYNGDRTLLTILAPLIATIPFAAQHIENRKSGMNKYLISRLGTKKYFNTHFFANMILAAIVFFVGMVLFLSFSFILFSKEINREIYYGMTRISVYEIAAQTSPLLYAFLIICHCTAVSAAYSSLGFACSFFIKNKFAAWISPFILSTIVSLFAMFIGITKLEPMAVFDVSRVKDINLGFMFLYLLIVISGSYTAAYNKLKKDMCSDEEF